MSITAAAAEPVTDEARITFRQLVADGFTFADALAVFTEGNTILDGAYVDAARHVYGEAGSIEIDEPSIRSGSNDGGDYVLAWVWVDDADVNFPDDTEPDADAYYADTADEA